MSPTEGLARTFGRLYREAGGLDGSAWYHDAARTARRLARAYGVTKGQAAGVIAAMSPNASWKGNVTMARTILAAWANGEPVPPKAGLTVNVAKAWGILQGHDILATLNGPKTTRFYRSIMGHDHEAVVDMWMMRAAGFDHDAPTKSEYAMVAAALTRAATRAGVATNVLQAVVWTYVRGGAE